MSGRQYWKNQLPVIFINLLGMLALALFLIAGGNGIQTVLFVLAVWLMILVSCLLLFCYSRKKYLDQLLDMTEKLEERYLLPEIIPEPERADDRVFCQMMKLSEKSMLEHIGQIQRERQEYKEYIEQWIHEVKNLLRQNNVAVTAENVEYSIYSDDKWLRFILDQLISNAVKYRTSRPLLHFFAVKENDSMILSIADNGIGIPESDLPRIFEKGFTGQNGRTIHSSTGIGLYLCRRLCDKLGIGISASSKGEGTTISLTFHMNDFVTGARG